MMTKTPKAPRISLLALITITSLCNDVFAILPFGLPTSTPSSAQIDVNPNSPSSVSLDQLSKNGQQEEVGHYFNTDVVIVGGGLAGMALYIGIATHFPKIKVLLIEKRSDFIRAGATLGLASNGVKALNELANQSDFAPEYIQRHGRNMMPIEQIPVHVLPWWVVHDALLERAQNLTTVASISNETQQRLLIWNALNLTTFNEKEDCVELCFTDTKCRVRTKLVVAADGVRSTMRSLMGLPPAEDTTFRIWRGHVQVDDVQDERARAMLESLLDQGYAPFIVRDGLSYVVIFNHHECMPGLMLWQMGTPLQDDKDVTNFLTDVDDPKQKEILEALLQHTPSILYTKLSTINMDYISGSTVSGDNRDSKSDDQLLPYIQGWGGTKRCTLIGDAAHACRPTDGQGANMAFEDACVLVRMLKEHQQQSGNDLFLDAIEDLVLQFENARIPRVKRIHQDQAERALKQGKDWTRWSPEFMKWVYDGV